MAIESTPSSALTASTQRPIPLIARSDLRIERIDYLGIGYWVIKEPVGLKYYRLQPEQHLVLKLLDGNRSIEQVRDELVKEMPTVKLQLTDIQHLISDLHQKGLVYSKRPGQGASLLKQHREELKKKILNTLRSLLYIRLPGWDPELVLRFMHPYLRWIYHPFAVFLCMSFVVTSWILLGVQFETFRSQLPGFYEFFGWPNLIYMWATLGLAKIIHEFGHGLTCTHYGGECHEMGVMLLVFSPCLYCDVTDSWMLKNKWQRIAIGGAGMYIEVILSAIAVYVWWYTKPGEMLHNLALNTFFVTTLTTVIWNANPLMRFDGYYMAADFLEIPNLRPKADKLLRENFAWYCLGIESRPDPFMPESGRAGFIAFAIAAGIYRWFIMAAILTFLYTVLKPYKLQSIGITMAVTSVSIIVVSMFYNIYKIVNAPRIEPMSRPKIAVSLVVLVCVIAIGLFWPIPWHVEAMFIVEPHEVRHVYTTVPGQLEDVFVQPGQKVERGAVLAQLINEEKLDRFRELQAQRRVQKVSEETFNQLRDSNQRALAEQRLKTIDDQLQDYQHQIEELRVVAPISGVVVAPPRVPNPILEESKTRLRSFIGTPMDAGNEHCYLEERTHLLDIAPDDNFQAILLVDQGDRNDLVSTEDVASGFFAGKAATPIELKFDHLPDRTFEGTIEKISQNKTDHAPGNATTQSGGELATVRDSQGRERLQNPVYQASVLLGEDSRLLRSGMRGRARFLVDYRTTGEWIWRYLRRTFQFRL